MPTKIKGTTGVDKVEAGAVITNPSFSGNATVSGSLTVGGVNVFSGLYRNIIINGDMRIDQRNAGASVTPTNGSLGIDRWQFALTQASKFTAQQSSDAPTGFSHSMVLTSSSAYSILSGDIFYVRQKIEGFNSAHLEFGTANAKTVTLSFWVKSSLTGNWGGSLQNSAENRSYPFTYTINSANTWEQKTVTISGDTTGTWIGSTNGIGLAVLFGLGNGSTYSGTAGAWASAQAFAPTSAVSLVGTSGATFYITGVQLEVGDTATPFEHRPFDMELQRCLRYYEKSFPYTSQPDHGIDNRFVPHSGSAGCGGNTYTSERFRVEKRANPTLRIFDCNGSGTFSTNLARFFVSCDAGVQTSTLSMGANTTLLSGYIQGYTASTIGFNFTADAEL